MVKVEAYDCSVLRLSLDESASVEFRADLIYGTVSVALDGTLGRQSVQLPGMELDCLRLLRDWCNMALEQRGK